MMTITIPDGYAVINTKTKNFVDYDGEESRYYSGVWDSYEGAKEVVDDIDFLIKNRNNVSSRKVKRNRKYLAICKVTLNCEVLPQNIC